MSSGAKRMVTGGVIGTGSAFNVKTVGFRPTRVEFFNADGLCHAYWQNTMANASMVLTITDGTITFETSDGITPLADGFTVGANSDLNVATQVSHWVAFD